MHPLIEVDLKDSMSDAAIKIHVNGLKAHQLISLCSYTTIDNGNAFECVAQFKANDKGCIDLQKDIVFQGSYSGIEPMRLFWAMKPSLCNKRPYARFAKLDVTTPLVVTIKAYDASMKSLEELHDMRKKGNLDQLELASVKVNRWFMAPGTKRITLTMKKDGIHGTLFIPPGDGPFPGVITMFGGYPGTMEFKASLLASHGFAALALALYGVPGLHDNFIMESDLTLNFEYFIKAVSTLSEHPLVNSSNGIGLIGLSMSSSIVLEMAERIEKVKCVIWLNGALYPFFSSVTYKGNVIYTQEPYDYSVLLKHGFVGRYYGRYYYPNYSKTCQPQKKGVIKFYNKHNVAYMFIAGLDDQNTPSDYFINEAEKLLKQAKHPDYQILRYPGAGHLIEPPYSIHNHTTAQKGVGLLFVWGGKMLPHCKAQEDSWPKQIQFLKHNLGHKIVSNL